MNLLCSTPNKPLHFHHVQKHLKVFSIGVKLHYSVYDTIRELRKCIILCSSCHSNIHRMKNRVFFRIGKFEEYFYLLIKENFPPWFPQKSILPKKVGKLIKHNKKMQKLREKRQDDIYRIIMYRYPVFQEKNNCGLQYGDVTISFFKNRVSIKKYGFSRVDYEDCNHKSIIKSLDMMLPPYGERRPLKKRQRKSEHLFLPDELDGGILVH